MAAISRSQQLKELIPGLNALFGNEYARYGEEHKEIFEDRKSTRLNSSHSQQSRMPSSA